MDTLIQLRLFGAVSIHDAEGNDLRAVLGQSKRTALLAYLAIARPRTTHRRETLLALFWPELSEERARRALNQSVYYIRTRLGHDSIVVKAGDEIGLSRSHIACDVVTFENHLDAGEEERALSLYTGSLLSGFHLASLLEFEHWAEAERSRLNDRAAKAAWTLADKAAETGDAHNAIAWARRSMELSHDEAAVRHLISMRDRFGDRAGAIREYDRFARQLALELEADPSPETQAMIAQIRVRSGTSTPLVSQPIVPPPEPEAEPQGVVQTEAPRVTMEKAQADPPGERRSLFRRALLLASIPVIAASGWALNSQVEARREPPILPGTVAIFPFSYTGSTEHAEVAEALVNLLDANIENVAGVKTVDWRSLKGFVDRSLNGNLTSATAVAAARRFNAQWYIVGSISESGDRLRVTASVYDRRSGEEPGLRAMVEGEPSQLFTIVDELTAKLVVGSDPSARLYRSATLTTSSMEALRAYLNGERDYREARYASALQHFRRATEADSVFSLAWFRLSQSASLANENALAQAAAAEALVPERGLGRYERQHAEAWSLSLQGRIPQALRLYEGLATADTTDVEALQQLAYLRFNWGPRYGRPAEESARDWRRVLTRDPYNPLALVNLARIFAREGDRDEFMRITERIAKFGPESDRAAELRALQAFVFGDSASQAAVIDDLATANPAVQRRLLMSVLSSTRDPGAAMPLVERYLAMRSSAGDESDSWILPAVSMARGRIKDALAQTEPAVTDGVVEMEARGAVVFMNPGSVPREEIVATRNRLASAALTRASEHSRVTISCMTALLDLRLADTASAIRAARKIETMKDRDPDAERFAKIIRAEVRRAHGAPAEALTILGDPMPTGNRIPEGFAFPLAHERYLRAELLRETGRSAEAARWYATFPDPAGYDLWYAGLARRQSPE